MDQYHRQVSFLASVTSESEALLCATLGADIIDAKDPSTGALGALPGERVRAIRAAVPEAVPVSATVGDPIDDPETIAHAARFMAQAGADIVKVGFWPDDAAQVRTVQRLGALALGPVRFVAVLLADRGLNLQLIGPMQEAGFAGVMLDTADKRAGALPDRLDQNALSEFVNAVQSHGMFAGLAGSLRASHVPQLLGVQPDVLGFRGGLCRDGARTASVDADAVRAVRAAVPLRGAALAEACGHAPHNAIARWKPGRAV